MPVPYMALSVKRQEHNRSLHTHTHTGGEDFLLKKQDGKDQEGRKSKAVITE